MSIDIDQVFGDLYPGSRQRRRMVARPAEVYEPSWDAVPTVKMYNGKPTEFYNIGALAKALGKSVVSVRLWERLGHIPAAPFRLPAHTTGQGKEISGRRLYSRELIEIVVDEFNKRGLIGKRRVDWKKHPDLTIAIAERWQRSQSHKE